MNLYDRVKDICSDKGISVMQLERDLGFTHGAFYKWRFFNPTIRKATKVAEYFGITLSELMDGVELLERTETGES